jgi:hypothetical protein
MLRVAVIIAVLVVLTCASAFRVAVHGHGDMPYPVNNLQESRSLALNTNFWGGGMPEAILAPLDTTLRPQILMLNYTAYDSAYANKVRRIIQLRLPGATCQDFWEGSELMLQQALAEKHVAIVAYPSGGQSDRIRSYGKVLEQFIRQGGIVIFTGTHYYNILQQFNLLEVQKGYFCKEPLIREGGEIHALLDGIPGEFALNNYAYPLDIRDPAFVSLADVQGYPVLGYKPLGAGQILYIGLEYYYDESISSRIMANAVLCGMPDFQSVSVPEVTPSVAELNRIRTASRTELLYAGSGSTQVDLKIYPNPYAYKGFLEIDLKSSSSLFIEMTDVNGRQAAVLLPKRSLQQGFYRFELPDVEPGIYFVQCYFNENAKEVRKVVKVAEP